MPRALSARPELDIPLEEEHMVLTPVDFTTENDIKDAIQQNPEILEEGLFIIGRELAT